MRYTGPVWDGPAVHPELWDRLNQTDQLIEIPNGPPPYRVILGVPHHAARGVETIAEKWFDKNKEVYGRAADETTGLSGLAVYQKLVEQNIACLLVISAHSTRHDPNKDSDSPYWKSIFADPLPALLFELHGAAETRNHDLELSAGKNSLGDPLAFARRMLPWLEPHWILAAQVRPGHKAARVFRGPPWVEGAEDLQNPALYTASLQHAAQAGVPALHLEMKPMFREPEPAFPASPRPTQAGWKLAEAIARSLGGPGKEVV